MCANTGIRVHFALYLLSAILTYQVARISGLEVPEQALDGMLLGLGLVTMMGGDRNTDIPCT